MFPAGQPVYRVVGQEARELRVVIHHVLAAGSERAAGAQDARALTQSGGEVRRVVEDLAAVDDVYRAPGGG